jgi:phosphoribosylformylglycinamidine synthase
MDFSKYGIRKKNSPPPKPALGREPNECELRILGVMWSEHCSYKSTKHLLKHFPTRGPKVVLGPGENAGIVDLGDGLGAAFKAESHNHPSAVAPYQGAATGVGGIIRDILALGARPVASMDGLFFGDPEHPRTGHLSAGIVKGVGDYGNAVGVPTVGGKTVYDPCYNENPLLNAFCIGLVELDKIVSSQTARPGQLVVLLGSKTGRDGIAGAAFASVELSEDAKESRPSIQIGDPFAEKMLIEACLELKEKNLIVSMQDMGAAGITSSSSEVAAKSGVGMKLHFDRVPLRAADMEPWEIALSESQERMLLIVAPEHMEEVSSVARKWELDCAVIGETEEGDDYSIFFHGEKVASLPATLIGDGCPPFTGRRKSPPILKQDGISTLTDFPLRETGMPRCFPFSETRP